MLANFRKQILVMIDMNRNTQEAKLRAGGPGEILIELAVKVDRRKGRGSASQIHAEFSGISIFDSCSWRPGELIQGGS